MARTVLAASLCEYEPIFESLFEQDRFKRSPEVVQAIGFIVDDLDHVERLIL
ncbi:MAG: hypothetical protein ACOYNZ_10390 [Rhodoferax sp.]